MSIAHKEEISSVQTRFKQERHEAAVAALKAALEEHPTEHPHHLVLGLWDGITLSVQCPGREHCPLWYEGPNGGLCGVQVEVSEVGCEFLEWMVGPEYAVTQVPVPFHFTATGGSEEDPPELEWWPIPLQPPQNVISQDDARTLLAVCLGDRFDTRALDGALHKLDQMLPEEERR